MSSAVGTVVAYLLGVPSLLIVAYQLVAVPARRQDPQTPPAESADAALPHADEPPDTSTGGDQRRDEFAARANFRLGNFDNGVVIDADGRDPEAA